MGCTEMFQAGIPPKGALVQRVCSPVASRKSVISCDIPRCISMSCCLMRLPSKIGLKYTKVMTAKAMMAATMLRMFLFFCKKVFFIMSIFF